MLIKKLVNILTRKLMTNCRISILIIHNRTPRLLGNVGLQNTQMVRLNNDSWLIFNEIKIYNNINNNINGGMKCNFENVKVWITIISIWWLFQIEIIVFYPLVQTKTDGKSH